MRKQIAEFWFTQSRHPFAFGLVIIEEQDGGDKGTRNAYIGVVDGESECRDVKMIREHGQKLDAKRMREIMDLFEGKKEMATDHDHNCEAKL